MPGCRCKKTDFLFYQGIIQTQYTNQNRRQTDDFAHNARVRLNDDVEYQPSSAGGECDHSQYSRVFIAIGQCRKKFYEDNHNAAEAVPRG